MGRRAVRETTDELDELRRLAEEAPALAKPLRQLLETIDDRKRAVEPDPRAAATDPPAPDKTHISGQGGFTGMEAIWNYFFWQTLSTNALDDLGHVLRLNVSVSPCSGYFNHREGQEAVFDQCRQWLGPNQPAINQPDPTAAAEASRPTSAGAPAASLEPARSGERTRPRLPAGPMKRRRGGALSASPVLVGAVTVLVTLVAVFISYSANEGLPFVPTYQIKAEVPNASKLVEGNDVRAGGFRIGQVTKIRGARGRVDGERAARSPSSSWSSTRRWSRCRWTRPSGSARARRSASSTWIWCRDGPRAPTWPGTPSRCGRGDTAPEDLEDVLSTFQPETRVDARQALQGFGNGLAGRGPALNRTIEELRPFLTRLEPVMRALSARPTELRGLFPALGQTLRQAAPVAAVQAAWIADMADTFAAIGSNPRALQETIEESAPTLDAAIASFQVQTPFLARFADLSRRLQPAAAELPRALPPLNRALSAGVPAFRRTPELAGRLEQLFRAAEDLGENPFTLLALRDLRTTAQIARPAVQFVAPYQTVCNYLNYFFTPLGTHLSEAVPGGTSQRILAKLLFGGQPNNLGTTESSRPGGHPRRPARGERPGASQAAQQPGGGQPRPGRLPGGPDRLPQPPRDRRPLPAWRPTRRASSAAARTSSSIPTRRAGGAAPTRRASSASAAWGRCPDAPAAALRAPGGPAGDRADRRVRVLRGHEDQPVREPLRAPGDLPRRPQHRDGLAGADRRRGGRQGHEARVERGRRGHGDDGAARRRAAAPPRRHG